MKSPATNYSPFRTQLLEEKAALAQRIARLDEALRALDGLGGSLPGRKPGRKPGRPSATPTAAAAPAGKRRKRRSVKRVKNELSLHQAMVKAMSGRPLTKPEILSGVLKEGYTFAGSKPMNSINVHLYTKGQFKKLPGKRFAPAK